MASWLFSRRVLRPLDACFNLLLEEGMLVFYSLWGVSFRRADSRRKPITPAHGCAHGHVHLCREDGEGKDRAPHGTHLRKTPRLPPNDREPGLIRPTRHRLLASTVCVLERVALLPNGALATARLQLRVLHLLNIRWYPGEEVQKLIIVDGIGVSKLLSEFVYAPD